MFDSILGFITQAVSSSVFIFCFCNLIIVIILVGSKSSFNLDDQGGEIPPSVLIIDATTNHKHGTNSEQVFNDSKLSRNIDEDSCSHEASVADGEENYRSNNKEDDNDKGEDELRKQVEEFIDKINKGWKAELGSSRLV
ncbi:hypothetical protein I3843_04G056900 [Carya illinoinensis]|uniref:Uncharacterized protein n=1 Tax=Carya illinoinensis TaxID=32201 RepID=A0A922JU63_CARIL|nr:hypothetical protein I3842_04G063100 [Carya illinoinensis]KAG7982517.1 hypothetical protein I3843_04G056900 [Carya illinoinensis]